MSSYVNIYLKHKDNDNRIFFVSYSRNSDIYQMFQEEFGYNNEFRELSQFDLTKIMHDLQEELYEIQVIWDKQSILKHDDIISLLEKQRIANLKLGMLHFLYDILDTIEYNDNYTSIEFNFD